MQHIALQEPSIRGGGRKASDRYRQSLELSDNFTGLEETTNRYDLLLLVKRTGKIAGFTPRMINLLDYYMAYTRDMDWEEGSRPIVYQSLARTALDMGVSERQIQKLEQQLFTLGAITWNDSGNHKRYGQRDSETGRILFAYGVDLTPLAYLREELEEKLREKQLYDQAWLETKRQISWYRRQIRSHILELQEKGRLADVRQIESRYDEIAIQLRTHINLSEMRSLLERHKSLHEEVISVIRVGTTSRKTQKHSCTSEQKFAHYKYTNPIKNNCSLPDKNCFQKSVAAPSEPEDLISASGLQHITVKQMLLAASDRFQGYLPAKAKLMNWNDVVEAAYQLRAELNISQQSWTEACETLGRVGASACVLLTDAATFRSDNPVRQPAAYFRGMIAKAQQGDLRLHNSVFGLLERQATIEHSCYDYVEPTAL